jgi:hypothetical protein
MQDVTEERPRTGRRQETLILLSIGLGLLIAGIIFLVISPSLSNAIFAGIGVLVSGLGGFAVNVTKKSNVQRGVQNIRIDRTTVDRSGFVGSAKEVHFHQGNEGTKPNQEQQAKPEHLIEKFTRIERVEVNVYQPYSLDLIKGDRVAGKIKSDAVFNVYILTANSFKSFEHDYNFNSLWKAESVRSCTFTYVAEKSGKVYVAIYSDEVDSFSASVDLRVYNG